VLPVPAQVRPDPAADFTISDGTAISAGPGAAQLAALLRAATGHPLPVRDGAAEITLLLDDNGNDAGGLGDEGYAITIAAGGVTIKAAATAGLFWAGQTLCQLLPVAGATLPGGEIVDRPRFAYRGAMLDVARHFWTVDEVKAYVDALVQFKVNYLHLHLTDDQGWRLEIDSWPRLTEVSGGTGTGVDGVGPGFYTQAEYSDLVAYAADRFVTVVPEIDMPGHVNAAQVAYEELTEDGIAAKPRTDQEVGYSSLVAGKEETYAFVEDVIREVAALTPGPYLHIGGDEAKATSPDDYRTFMTRVLPLVAKYGKHAIGWHEMAAVELPETAVPQFWRTEATDEGTARQRQQGDHVAGRPHLSRHEVHRRQPARPGLGRPDRRGPGLRLGPRDPAAGRRRGRAARRRGGALVGDVAHPRRRADHDVPAAGGHRGDRLVAAGDPRLGVVPPPAGRLRAPLGGAGDRIPPLPGDRLALADCERSEIFLNSRPPPVPVADRLSARQPGLSGPDRYP
jgi:hexosaminidase